MTNTTDHRTLIEQLVDALDHCMAAITERGLNGSPDQAEKWGLQLPLVRAESAITAAQSMLANPTPQHGGEAEPEWTDENVIAYCIARGISAAKAFTTGATQPQATEPAPSTAGKRKKVVEDLLMYAGDNGYSHIDYADTMRHAAALLSAPALPVGELPAPFHPSASHINPDYRDGWNAALAAASSQPVREPLTLEELELCRQWFNSVQDTNGGYFGNADYVLAEKLYGILKIRCPNSITSVVGGITKKGGE